MFLHYDNDYFKKEIEEFNKKQNNWCIDNNIKLRTKDYLHNKYLQYITLNYLEDKDDEENKKLFSQALDILIRHNITAKNFINYNDEMKNEFYSCAISRCITHGLKTFKPELSAFNYFTTVITSAFKQILNEDSKERMKEKNSYQSAGLEGVIYNAGVTDVTELESDFEIQGNVLHKNPEIAPFIYDLKSKYNCKHIRILENPGTARFLRKYSEFKYFIPVIDSEDDEKGVVIEYIDLNQKNEDMGVYSTYYQNRNLIARRNGHQVFMLYSDVYNDEDIPDKIIWDKINTMITMMKENSLSSTGVDPMIDYIPYSMIDGIGLSKPSWFPLDENRNKRGFIINQDVQEYIRIKDINPNSTRVFDCGKINLVN